MEKEQINGALAEDYAALVKRLRHYPQISIVSTKKDPPEQYTIEYKIFGYGYKGKGKIEMRRRHQVQIELPFGYPHFPPTVKPLTSICHPDIDEHAIRIADQWQRNPSLTDLVIYIADMIRGEIYSREGTFNPGASEWYEARKAKLPLADLKYIEDPERVEQRRSSFSFGRFFKRLVLTVGLLVTLGIAGVYYHDMMYIRGAENAIKDGRELMDERRFSEARADAEQAQARLDRVFILQLDKEEHLRGLDAFIHSREMEEGLEGRIAHNGIYYPFATVDALGEIDAIRQTALSRIAAGDPGGAVADLEGAITLAEEKGLAEELESLKKLSTETRLKDALANANSSYEAGQWKNAAGYYGEVVAIIEKERRLLPENTVGTLRNIRKLLVLSQVHGLKEDAQAAEKEKKYSEAAGHNRALAQLISRSGYSSDAVLDAMLVEARKENARLVEQAQVSRGSSYLIDNYKEIFTRHYPGISRPALKSPKVRYMGRAGGNYVFIMSCIELVKKHATEYRLYYQYNPGTSQWSLYTERKSN